MEKLLANAFLDIASSRWQNLKRVNASLTFLPCLRHLPLPRPGLDLTSPLFSLIFLSGNLIGHMLELPILFSVLCMFYHLLFLYCIFCNCSSVSFSSSTLSEIVPNFLFSTSMKIVIFYLLFLEVTFGLLKSQLLFISYRSFFMFSVPSLHI